MSGMTRRRALAGMAGMAGMVGCDGDGMSLGPGEKMYGSFVGKTPPSLESGGTWFNADAPLTIKGLAGNVVWLEFSFMR